MSNLTPLGLSSFHRFFGWRLLALIAVFTVYTLWFTGPGYFGQMTRIDGHISLQKSGFYSGATAVEILSKLDGVERKIKYLNLIFDLPYMIMQALVFEALIAFGLRHMRPKSRIWNLLFLLPIGFLLADLAEDSFIALTLATGSEVLGTLAGFMTAFKFLTFIPAILVSVLMAFGGIIAWVRREKAS